MKSPLLIFISTTVIMGGNSRWHFRWTASLEVSEWFSPPPSPDIFPAFPGLACLLLHPLLALGFSPLPHRKAILPSQSLPGEHLRLSQLARCTVQEGLQPSALQNATVLPWQGVMVRVGRAGIGGHVWRHNTPVPVFF